MKLFFSITISLLLAVTTLHAQPSGPSDKEKQFIIQRFPNCMLEYVLANAEEVPVTEKYAKRHDDQYIYTDLAGNPYPGKLRVGDTILVFKGKPFFSKGQLRYIDEAPKEEVVKQKRQRSPEEKKQNQELILQGASVLLNAGTRILGGNGSYLGNNTPRMGNASTGRL